MQDIEIYNADRIRSLEMVTRIFVAILEGIAPSNLEAARGVFRERLEELSSVIQLPGAGGASRLSLEMALELLDVRAQSDRG
jgi:hypothetical protein